MLFKEYAVKTVDEIVPALGSSVAQGLSTSSATAKLKKFGRNQQEEKDVSFWVILFRNMTSMFVILFFVIDVFFLALGEWSNASIVSLLILINIGVGCYQEYKASKTIKLLKKYIENVARVLRDGKQQEVPASELVPGDIIFLKAGDIVSADVRIMQEADLLIDEAVITGEAAPIKKTNKILETEPDLFKSFNIAFTGTLVTEGKATGIIFATGNNTIFGSLVKSSYRGWQESTLEKAVVQLSKFIFLLSIISLVCAGIGNVIVKGVAGVHVMDMLVFGVALMVCLVPEALPIVITFNLSLCVRRLLKLNVVVKRLSALEDFGAVEILCVDKTGTLTEHNLHVVNTFAQELDNLLLYAGLGIVLQKNMNNFESAIEEFLTTEHPDVLKHDVNDYTYVSSSPFDPQRRRSGVLVQKKDSSEYIYVVRGAYEMMAEQCFTPDERAHQWIVDEGKKGNRTIAVAIKKLNAAPSDLLKEEEGLTLVGILAFSDPIKKTAPQALEQARKLGITIKVISGDAPEVCGSVAYALHLIDDPAKVVTSKMLENASLEEKEKLITQGVVFSRILPDQKAEIVKLLKGNKRIGFLGDGLNDLPALMAADVALVVQGCPDVVREAGDIVLLNRSLLSVVHAIKEGRTVLANTMKYIKTTLAPSFGHFYALTIASLFVKNTLPMLPIQLLLVNFLSDFPMISLATDTVEIEDLSHPQQYNIRSILFLTVVLGMVSMVFDFICFSYFMRQPEHVMQTGWFIETVLTEVFFIFAIRSRKPFFRAKLPSLTLSICAIASIVGAISLPHTAFGQRMFKFAVLDMQSLQFVCGLSILFFFCVEIIKYLYYQFPYFKNGNSKVM